MGEEKEGSVLGARAVREVQGFRSGQNQERMRSAQPPIPVVFFLLASVFPSAACVSCGLVTVH